MESCRSFPTLVRWLVTGCGLEFVPTTSGMVLDSSSMASGHAYSSSTTCPYRLDENSFKACPGFLKGKRDRKFTRNCLAFFSVRSGTQCEAAVSNLSRSVNNLSVGRFKTDVHGRLDCRAGKASSSLAGVSWDGKCPGRPCVGFGPSCLVSPFGASLRASCKSLSPGTAESLARAGNFRLSIRKLERRGESSRRLESGNPAGNSPLQGEALPRFPAVVSVLNL